jgi:uncharacterized RDD family membrane protein YckC
MNNFMNQDEVIPTTTSPDEASPSPARPWLRFWARNFDILLFNTVLSIVWLTIDEQSYYEMSNLLFAVISIFLYIFVEAFFLSTWGTTLGKKITKTTIKNNNGSQLSGYQSLKRSRLVWLRGMGLGIGIVQLVANIMAYQTLRSNGRTSWDHDMDLLVSHEKLGIIRIIQIVIIFILCLSFVVAKQL